MERASLKEFLSQGLSLAEIGKRFGKHEATVAYWLKKHELAPSFITSTRPARSSGCRDAVRVALPRCDLRRGSVCCSAPIATQRSRRVLQSFRKMSVAIVSQG